MVVIADKSRSPYFDPRGWMQWPANEDYSFQFMRLLGAAQEGGSTISECMLAASGIDPGCEESWYRQWKKAGDTNKARGDIALARGFVSTALSNWLRAASYFRTAQAFMSASDKRRGAALRQMVACSQLYLRHMAPAGEAVEIAWSNDRTLPGYFLPAPGRGARRAPVVMCIGAPEHYKEEHLYRMPRYAHERGLSLLLVDLPGQGVRRADARVSGRYDIETAVSSWLDYLTGRSDVDAGKIAVFGDGLGAPFATRAAGFDDRFAAAVCDAGIWDLHERAFLTLRKPGAAGGNFAADIDQLCRGSIARTVKCPILVALGEHDWLDAGHVRRCCEAFAARGQDIDLKIFSASETAASHAQLDNPTIGNEFIFDWIADRLGCMPATATSTAAPASPGLRRAG